MPIIHFNDQSILHLIFILSYLFHSLILIKYPKILLSIFHSMIIIKLLTMYDLLTYLLISLIELHTYQPNLHWLSCMFLTFMYFDYQPHFFDPK